MLHYSGISSRGVPSRTGVDATLAVKRFSQLGGLQLDRDVRALVAYAGELTQRPVRDKFAELTQVSFAAGDPRSWTAVRR